MAPPMMYVTYVELRLKTSWYAVAAKDGAPAAPDAARAPRGSAARADGARRSDEERRPSSMAAEWRRFCRRGAPADGSGARAGGGTTGGGDAVRRSVPSPAAPMASAGVAADASAGDPEELTAFVQNLLQQMVRGAARRVAARRGAHRHPTSCSHLARPHSKRASRPCPTRS